MRLTHEADYAVRIVFTMMQGEKLMSARVIAEEAGITLRFALKILRKLAADEIVTAVKGATGGYRLAVKPEALSLGRVIECIDGPFELAHCMTVEYDCTRMEDKAMCSFHRFYRQVSGELRDRFYSMSLADFRSKETSPAEMKAVNQENVTLNDYQGGNRIMKKFVCSICGYTHEGDAAPEACPLCKAPADKFNEISGDKTYITEHVIGALEGVPEDIIQGLRENFAGECAEVGMYLAMSRQADREGYPEIAEAYKRYAFEEADHAARFAELLGEVVKPCTKTNLQMRADAECGACDGKMQLAKRAKELNLDAIHDTVHEMAKDEARHGRGFDGLLARYFGK